MPATRPNTVRCAATSRLVSAPTTWVTGEQQTFNANRAFIQWAGFTFGRAASFFDFYAGAAVSYFGFYPQSDTGDGG